MLLVNPTATSTNSRTRDVLIRALGAAVDLCVEETGYRGHAAKLAAAAEGFDVVAVLGGDGTINETVNGLLADSPAAPPALAVIPGGSANVFARALGLPNDPVEATSVLLEALREHRRRPIGLGQVVCGRDVSGGGWADDGSRYFTFCAGVGWDAEVVRAVEGLRGAGYRASPFLYGNAAVRHYFLTDRRHPALRLEVPGRPAEDGLFLGIVCNTAPWTYAGSRPINPTPLAGFDTGLDLLGLKRLGLPTVARVVRQIIGERDTPLRGRHLVQLHDEREFTLVATRPIAFELDGDYLGERERMTFRSRPNALQVVV